jgi:hypothetical protein
MEEKAKIETIIQDVRHYIETRMKILLLDTTDKASSTISSIASMLLLAVSLIFVLLFLSIGAALWIGNSFGETSMGFLIIGLFYLVVGIILYAGRKSIIKTPVANSMLNSFYSDENN